MCGIYMHTSNMNTKKTPYYSNQTMVDDNDVDNVSNSMQFVADFLQFSLFRVFWHLVSFAHHLITSRIDRNYVYT